MRRFLSVVGARPQFIKAASVHEAFAHHGGADHGILHTGQHYDARMSQVFFDELGIPPPRFNLGIGSDSPAAQIGRMIIGLEEVLASERSDVVIVYGDTNSTLAGAIAANKLRLPVAHVEAGLRSWNKSMPEEANRVLCDHCSDCCSARPLPPSRICDVKGSPEPSGKHGMRADSAWNSPLM